MNRYLGICITLLMSALMLQAQESPPFSHHRLSIEIRTGYHFNPWDNYNGAVQTVVREIQRNAFFVNPGGFYEKINGDLLSGAALRYRIFRGFSAGLTYRRGSLSARFEAYPDEVTDPTFIGSPAHHQKIDLTLSAWGPGIGYRYRLSRLLALQASLGIEKYSADLDLSFRHDRAASGPLGEDEGQLFRGAMSDGAWGWQGGLSVAVAVVKNISLSIGAGYRNLSMGGFRGEADPSLMTDVDGNPLEITLVEATNYFGVQLDPDQIYAIGLPPLTFFTAPDEFSRTPATIDFTAFGLQGGITIGF